MSSTIAVQLLLLGSLTLIGTAEAVLVAPLLKQSPAPACCRRRVDVFEARARWVLLAAGATILAGVVLLFV